MGGKKERNSRGKIGSGYIDHIQDLTGLHFEGTKSPEEILTQLESLSRPTQTRSDVNAENIVQNILNGATILNRTANPSESTENLKLSERQKQLLASRIRGESLENMARLNNTTRDKIRDEIARTEMILRRFKLTT